MTLARRLIVCLDVRDGRVVKGVRFEGLRDVGDPVELAMRYEAAGADEVVFLNKGEVAVHAPIESFFQSEHPRLVEFLGPDIRARASAHRASEDLGRCPAPIRSRSSDTTSRTRSVIGSAAVPGSSVGRNKTRMASRRELINPESSCFSCIGCSGHRELDSICLLDGKSANAVVEDLAKPQRPT